MLYSKSRTSGQGGYADVDKRMSVKHTPSPMAMRRTTIWLSKQQIQLLAKLSKRKGIKVSELVRRFIDEGLEKGSN
jgi:hypothetical protein